MRYYWSLVETLLIWSFLEYYDFINSLFFYFNNLNFISYNIYNNCGISIDTNTTLFSWTEVSGSDTWILNIVNRYSTLFQSGSANLYINKSVIFMGSMVLP